MVSAISNCCLSCCSEREDKKVSRSDGDPALVSQFGPPLRSG